jgi:hypothetical protein
MASITRRSKETYQAEIRRKGLAKISKCFSSRKAAESWARKIESELERGHVSDNSAARSLRLGDLLTRYRAEVTPTKKSGACSETYVIGRLLREPIAERLIINLRARDFAAYRDTRLSYVCGDSVIKELNLISAIYERARKEWDLPIENPLKLVQRPAANPGRQKRVSRALRRSFGSSYTLLAHL